MATISNNEIKIKYTLDTTDLANATALFDKLSAEDRQLLNDLKKLQTQLNATGQAGQQAGNQIASGTSKASKQFDILGSSIKQVGGYIAGYLSVQAIVSFGKAVLDTTVKMEGLRKAIEFTSGTITGGIANFKFLEQVAEELGLPLQAAAEGFKSMSAAASRSNISMEQQRQMFYDLSKSMAALQLTSQDASLVFFGFGQLMSKSKVSAQELYHQIGERLPIAMQAAQIAAAKMTGQVSITTTELIKLVEEGKLMSSEFAPAFTEALGQLAGDAAKIETLGKSVTRFGNAYDKMLVDMGESNKGFWKDTIDGFARLFINIGQYFKGFSTEGEQLFSYETALEKAKKMSEFQIKGQIDFFENQKRIAKEELDAIQKTYDQLESQRKVLQINGKDFIGVSPQGYAEAKRKFEDASIALAGIQGKFDAYVQALKELNKTKIEPPFDPEATEKLYKILIDQQEAAMKAEEDLIKSRTKAGTNQDILIIENRIKFNNIMLEIDKRAMFAKLELAKNNRVKREAELIKDAESEDEIIRQARFKAYANEKQYIDKTNELLQDNRRKRRQETQTDEQNQLETSFDFYEDQLKVLTDKYKETIKIEGLQKKDLQRLEFDYYRAKYELTQDGEKAAADIRAKFRQKEKEDAIKAGFDVRSTVVEAASIRNQALAKTDMQRADIAEEAAMTQLQIEKEKNHAIAQEQLNAGGVSEAQKKIINDNLFAQDVLLDAKMTQLVKDGETRRLEYKLEIFEKTMEVISDAFSQITDLYIADLNRQKDALGMKYDADVRLADGNKQKLAQLAQEKARAEYEIELKQFRARQLMAVAEVIFKTAPEIARWIATGVLAPVAAIGLAAQGFAIGAILSQPPPVPPYKDGTKGIPHPGGPAIVGEAGVEKVVTTTGQVYYTPSTATLIDLPKGSQVIPNHALSKKEMFWANSLSEGRRVAPNNGIENKLDKIGGILQALPIHQINMNERGFEKFVRTERRTTKILNNRFPLN
jgi:tape measure domain-containing protein